MKKTNIFLLLVVVVAVGSGLLLLAATANNSSAVMIPSEVLASVRERKELSIERIRVAARVADAEVNYVTSPKISLSFSVHDRESGGAPLLPVLYNGLKPDMFAPGRDVLIDGDYKDGVLHAHQLLTQCPSKYEPADPGTQQDPLPKISQS